MTPWQTLGIPPGSSRADAERAYRRRIRRAHPDAGGSAAEATALNLAIAWVRRQSVGPARHPRPAPAAPIATEPRHGPEPVARPARKRGHTATPASVATVVVVVVALVFVALNWQAVLLATTTLLALAIIASGLRD